VAILQELKKEWQLKADVPTDFDGLPLMNAQNSWFMPSDDATQARHYLRRDKVPRSCSGESS
jgi:hypothetical protein